MTPEAVRQFATRLMREVWEPFDSSRLGEFYHPDVVGHHRSQIIRLADIENRLAWDRKNRRHQNYVIRDIIAEPDRFSIRFVFGAEEIPAREHSEIEVVYFYHLREAKISEIWLLASVDFDYFQAA